MQNDILSYYVENSISPVHQDISNWNLHIERRRKLYRQCGIPFKFFEGKKILEVGPGSGYNTLVFFEWGANMTLVEPNPTGIEEARNLFKKMRIDDEKYDFIHSKIEDYDTEEKYDVVIAEGFLDAMDNATEIIEKLKSLVKRGGVIVITCADDVCLFIETMKRLIAAIMTKGIVNYDEKVDYLVDFFAPQLENLKGMSRPVKDWVEDQMICKSFINGNSLSMAEAVIKFEDFYFLGSSQRLFTDYSWYKDIWYDEKHNILEQFRKKRLSLLMAGMDEVILDSGDVDELVIIFKEIRKLASDFEIQYDNRILNEIEKLLLNLCTKADVFPIGFRNVLWDIKNSIEEIIEGKDYDISKYTNFYQAFGRTQQYLAFEKK